MTWHHAPAHHFAYGNTFFITGATHHKQHFYRAPTALDELQELLFVNAEKHECVLQSWCLLRNENAVHHGIVNDSRRYRWCSAGWFEQTAPVAFVEAVNRVKIDGVKIYDEY